MSTVLIGNYNNCVTILPHSLYALNHPLPPYPVDESYGFDSYSMKLTVRPPDMGGFENHPEWQLGTTNDDAKCEQFQTVYSNTAVRYLDYIKCSFVFTRGAAASIVARVIYPMAVISMLSVFTLWMSLDDRINALLALFATASAFYYVASDNLPTMHVWTKVDIYFTCVFTLSKSKHEYYPAVIDVRLLTYKFRFLLQIVHQCFSWLLGTYSCSG